MTNPRRRGHALNVDLAETDWERVVAELREGIVDVFGALRARCRTAGASPSPATGWTVPQILEHVTLTDRFLLILIDKISARARKRIVSGDPWPAHAPRFDVLQSLASREREWDAPEHMIPIGDLPIGEIETRLERDESRCLALLNEFPRGEGTLHRIRMSMVEGDDDRLDLYQFIEIVRLHARRHLAQIERIAASPA